MDWNRRWAKKRLMPKAYGHKKWVENVEAILGLLPKYWVDTVSLYALSTENMKREESELKDLFDLFVEFTKKKNLFEKNQIKFTHIWKKKGLPERVTSSIQELEEFTKDFKSLHFLMWVNYGWRDEIVRAVKKVVESWEEISEENLEKNLDTFWAKPLDLVIRTGGHQRISNFLMWQCAYSELYFPEVLWPDFDEKELKKALEFFESQQRNFGK